jgi:hypothetical protein
MRALPVTNMACPAGRPFMLDIAEYSRPKCKSMKNGDPLFAPKVQFSEAK